MMKLVGNAVKAYDMLVTSTRGICTLRMWAGNKRVKNGILSPGGARGGITVMLQDVRVRVKMVAKFS